MSLTNIVLLAGGIVLILSTLVVLFKMSFVSAPPSEIKVISGYKGQRFISGGTGYKIPIIERVDVMPAGTISADVNTKEFVPTNDYINIKVDASVKVRIATGRPDLLNIATRNFLYKSVEEISDEIRDMLEGHLRAIVGQLKLKEIVTDRTSFSEKVQENAKSDLAEMGLEIVSFNIQNLMDDSDVIHNLGVENTAKISKEARISKAIAEREVKEAEAKANQESNKAQSESELIIAQQNAELEQQKALLKTKTEIEQAKADNARAIQVEEQRKTLEYQKAQADITKAQQQALISEEEVKVKRQVLDADIKAKADADRYAIEQMAEAEYLKRQREIDAENYEQIKRAEANKQAMILESEGIKAKGQAEAEAMSAKGRAEALTLEKKAEAMAKMNEASILEMYFNILPLVAKEVASPLNNVGNITMYGEGNNTKMIQDVTNSMTQLQTGLTDSLGIKIPDLLNNVFAGRMIAPQVANALKDMTSDNSKQETHKEVCDEKSELDKAVDTIESNESSELNSSDVSFKEELFNEAYSKEFEILE